MEKVEPDREKALLVGVDLQTKESFTPDESLAELEELARSAGAVVLGRLLQARTRRNPAYLIGSGKLREIRDWVLARHLDLVIFDEELTPAQKRNLEEFLEVKILDRTEIILDIFCSTSQNPGGQTSGGVGSVAVSTAALDRSGCDSLSPGRRNWNPGTRRNQAGNGPANDSAPLAPNSGRTREAGKPPSHPAAQASGSPHTHGQPGRLHERR